MEFKCVFEEFKFCNEKFYRCLVKNQEIPENQELKFAGQHLVNKTNKDVTYLGFKNCTVKKIPQGLTKTFSNLKLLQILHSKLKKISKNDLVEYKRVEKLWIYFNEIEFLPERLFEGFENLEDIFFPRNRLKVIAPNILDGLTKLKRVNFNFNTNYNLCHSTYPGERSNATLEEIKTDLLTKYKQTSELYAEYMQQENPQLIFKMEKSIIDDFKAFIQNDKTKDFKIIIGNREFAVHKFLLAVRSPTLAATIKEHPEAENLNLIDISAELFEKILKFIYTDEFPDDFKVNFIHLHAAAAKLQIRELMNYAAVKITHSITVDNALEILKLSNKYKNEVMKDQAFGALKKKYPDVDLKADIASDMDKIEKFEKAIKRKEEAEKEFKDIVDYLGRM